MGFVTLYQVNTRILLQEVGAALGRPATLDDVPEDMLEAISRRGFSWLWLLGVWQTGVAGREASRRDARLRAELESRIPGAGLDEDDIVGSPFAIQAYDVHVDFGGEQALARLRERLRRRRIRLMLDFVPNHIALDHPWVFTHPEFLIHGGDDDRREWPGNYIELGTRRGAEILAHGRDPHFDAWRDTIQLNYRHRGLREAQTAVLARIADRCDGVRCDMAMLLEPGVISRTWGRRADPDDGSPPNDAPFWPEAIATVRAGHPDFVFVAEVYWDLEWTLQQHGFDFTYDKRLYDRLRAGVAGPVRAHLEASPAFLERSLHFLENHDEPRAAAIFDPEMHRAAAVVAFFAPGLRLIQEGQIEGRRARASVHGRHRLREPVDHALRKFYDQLLAGLARPEVQKGRFTLWSARPVDRGDPDADQTANQFIVSTWEHHGDRLLVIVNFAAFRGQCRVAIELPEVGGGKWTLIDLMSDARREEEGEILARDGFPVELPAWGFHVLAMRRPETDRTRAA
jgi:hypothetical protein